MNKEEIRNLDDMTNKIRDYIIAVAPDEDEVVKAMCLVASKFLMGSFLGKDNEGIKRITVEDIIDRGGAVVDICLLGGSK